MAGREPIFVNQSATARLLGLPRSTLWRMGKTQPLYAPTATGIPGMATGSLFRRYHRRQIELIEAVLAGSLDLDTATMEWEVFRYRLGHPVAMRVVRGVQQ